MSLYQLRFRILVVCCLLAVIGCKKKSSDSGTSSGGGVPPPGESPTAIYPGDISGDWEGTLANGKLISFPVRHGKFVSVAEGVSSGDSVSWTIHYQSIEISYSDNSFTATLDGISFDGKFTSTDKGSGSWGGVSWTATRSVPRPDKRVFEVVVSLAGDGKGKITDQNTFDCNNSPTSSCSRYFDEGSAVHLDAVPETTFDTFMGWGGACQGMAGCDLTIDGSKAVSATFSNSQSLITGTISPAGGGTISFSPDGRFYSLNSRLFDKNTTVTLTGSPNTGYNFSGWEGACQGSGPCTIVTDTNKAVTANFERNTFNVNATIAPAGVGNISFSQAGTQCGVSCQSFPKDTNLTLNAIPKDSLVVFKGWSGDCSGVGNCNLTLNSDKTVTATFDDTGRTLSVRNIGSLSRSKIKSSPGSINCEYSANCSERFPVGTVVTLSAEPDLDLSPFTLFKGWSGDCFGVGTCILTLFENRSVIGNFEGRLLDGNFSGTTNQGKTIALTVSNEKLTRIQSEVTHGSCTSPIDLTVSYRLNNTIKEYFLLTGEDVDLQNSLRVLGGFSGQFTSQSQFQGGAFLVVTTSTSSCGDFGETVRFSASRN